MTRDDFDAAYEGEVQKQMRGNPSLFDGEEVDTLVQTITRGIENTSSTDREKALAALHNLAIIADRAPVVIPEHMINGVPDCVLDRMRELDQREQEFGV